MKREDFDKFVETIDLSGPMYMYSFTVKCEKHGTHEYAYTDEEIKNETESLFPDDKIESIVEIVGSLASKSLKKMRNDLEDYKNNILKLYDRLINLKELVETREKLTKKHQ